MINITQLNTDLSALGVVSTLEIVSDVLNISIQVASIDQSLIDSYNQIIAAGVLPYYPVIDVVAFEGGAIKAIYTE